MPNKKITLPSLPPVAGPTAAPPAPVGKTRTKKAATAPEKPAKAVSAEKAATPKAKAKTSVKRRTAPKKPSTAKGAAAAAKAFRTRVAKSYKDRPSAISVGDSIASGWELLPTPSIILNHKLGGGLARGGVSVFNGIKGAGKTTLALRIIAHDQQMHPDSVWVVANVERSIDRAFMEAKGVDPDRCIQLNLRHAEEYTDALIEVLESPELQGLVRGVLLDSIAAMVPNTAFNASDEKQSIALVARLMAKHFPKIVPYLGDKGVTAIYTNHIKINPGMAFGNPEYSPGGSAADYYALMMMDMRRKEEELGGHKTTFQITKNKPAGGYEKARFALPFRHDIDFDPVAEVFGILTKIVPHSGALEVKGAYVYMEWEGERILVGQGKEACIQFLRDNPAIYNYLRPLAVEAYGKTPLEFVANEEVDEPQFNH